jgi:chemotaxis protein methyltransferase CheR
VNAADHELAQFRAIVTRFLGLVFEDRNLSVLSSVLSHRVHVSALSTASYLMRLETQAPPEELRALARELTIGETYFFRNVEQFNAFTELVLHARMREPGSAISLLSVGCASGEEPYTLAMLLRDHVGDARPWSIHALDISSTKLEHARAGRYARWSLRETPADAQRRWFRQDGQDLLLDAQIRNAVTFEEHNVVKAHPSLFREPRFDAVFCRNMLMYLEPQVAARVIEQIARALLPGGYLFLGHAESLRGVSEDFQLRTSHGAFYYQRKGATLHHPAAVSGDWSQTISNASRRIEALTGAGVPMPERWVDATGDHAVVPATAKLDAALRLLQDERFSEALAELSAMPRLLVRDPNVLLLRAVLLTHTGDFHSAKQACAELLTLDELHAGAHYLFGLCCEGEGDEAGASDHDRTAAHLDPTFAMPRLHLGLRARRSGDAARARHDLCEALALLQHESTSRLVLFGGGFKRDALLSLCRAELAACGGGA